MLIQIIDSQLLVFPNYKTFFYRGTNKDKSDNLKLEILTIKIMECSRDLGNFEYFGKVTNKDEITLIVKPSHYQDLIHLHLSRHKPDKMFLKMKNKYVSYYGFNC